MKSKKTELPPLKIPSKWKRVKRSPWAFSSKVSHSQRKDGEKQNKITIAKRFIDHVLDQDEPLEGTFLVERFDDEMRISFDRLKLPNSSTLMDLYSARWITLTCPFCGKSAKQPLFNDAYSRISDILIHECGAEYYCDLDHSETSFDPAPMVPEKESRWLGVVIHNYSAITGLVGFALNDDFDMMNPSALLNHVIFRVRKDSQIGKLGYTATDVYGKPVLVLVSGPTLM